jgi:large subunit ribosomal protein L20
MARATNTPKRLARKRRILKHAKGFVGNRSKLYRVMKESVHRAWVYAFKGRRLKKRDFRSMWIVRLSAASRARGMQYSRFIAGLSHSGVELNRKALSEIAIHDPKAFDEIFALASAGWKSAAPQSVASKSAAGKREPAKAS